MRAWQPQVSPYRTPLTNLLGCLAQYQILSVYLAVLLVNGEKSMQALGFTEFGVGLALVGLNSLVLVLAVGAGQRQFLAAEAEKARRMKKVSMSTQCRTLLVSLPSRVSCRLHVNPKALVSDSVMPFM